MSDVNTQNLRAMVNSKTYFLVLYIWGWGEVILVMPADPHSCHKDTEWETYLFFEVMALTDLHRSWQGLYIVAHWRFFYYLNAEKDLGKIRHS